MKIENKIYIVTRYFLNGTKKTKDFKRRSLISIPNLNFERKKTFTKLNIETFNITADVTFVRCYLITSFVYYYNCFIKTVVYVLHFYHVSATRSERKNIKNKNEPIISVRPTPPSVCSFCFVTVLFYLESYVCGMSRLRNGGA